VNSVGDMSPAGITAIQLWAGGLPKTKTITDGANNSVLQLIILRRQFQKLPLPFGVFDVVQTVAARTQFGTQRRRGDFGRTNLVPLGF